MRKTVFGSCVRAMSAVALALSVPCVMAGCGQAENPNGAQDAGDKKRETEEDSVKTGTAPASDAEVREVNADSDYDTIYVDDDGYYQAMCCRFKAIPGYGVPTQDLQDGRRPQTLVDEGHLDAPDAWSSIDVSTPIGYAGIDAKMEELASGSDGTPMTEGEGYVAQTGIGYRRADGDGTVMYVYEWDGTVMGVTMRNVSDEDAHLFLDTLEPYENMNQTNQMLLRESRILGRMRLQQEGTADTEAQEPVESQEPAEAQEAEAQDPVEWAKTPEVP